MITKKDFVEIADFTKDEYQYLLQVIGLLKEAEQQGVQLPLLKSQSLALMFDQPSTRTRVSFESAMSKLGGHALYLETKTMHVGEHRETLKDTALVLSGMCDAIEIRAEEQAAILEIAKWATVPVFSGMSSKCMHPTQVLCDLFTMTEHMPAGKKLEDLKVMWVGDNSVGEKHIGGVCRSEARLASIMGYDFISCAPKPAEMLPEDVAFCKGNYEKSGGRFIQTDDPYEYIDQVDFIITDAWWYHGSDHLKDEKIEEFYPKYSVDAKLIAAAPEHVKVMHPLPGNRGYEIAEDVWDGPHSLLHEQAANRYHTQKGLLAAFMYPRTQAKREALAQEYLAQAEKLLTPKFNKLAGAGAE